MDVLWQCSRVVFLVHGFNVDREDGTGELSALGAHLPALGEGAAVAVLWPGDSIVGPLCYPFKTNSADDTAIELSRFIADSLPQKPRISLVGHSLGCRVVMETARHLWIKNVAVDQICLMAAAIDNDLLASKAAYLDAAQYAARVGVLYSPSDHVLRSAYPLGNLLSAFTHWTSTTNAALGYTGPLSCSAPPAQVPDSVRAVGIPRNASVDHGDYLPDHYGQLNVKQQCAARFIDAMLAGAGQLAYV
jgi:esterase/lipase superfamily enzyme